MRAEISATVHLDRISQEYVENSPRWIASCTLHISLKFSVWFDLLKQSLELEMTQAIKWFHEASNSTNGDLESDYRGVPYRDIESELRFDRDIPYIKKCFHYAIPPIPHGVLLSLAEANANSVSSPVSSINRCLPSKPYYGDKSSDLLTPVV